MEWKSYEQTVKRIYEILGRDFGVKIECYGNSCKKKGKSGVEQQIDVLTSHSDGMHIYQTAIECKYWNEKINKDIVMKVIEIIEDCNINKGVIVSKLGFTPDAILFAKYRNVDLIELKEKYFKSKEGKSVKIFWNLEIRQPVFSSFNFTPENKIIMKNISKGLLSDYNFELPNGSINNLDGIKCNFLNNKVLKGTPLEIVTEEIVFPSSTLFKSKHFEDSFPVDRISMKGFIRFYTLLDSDYIKNKVFLIMKKVFENRNYMVSENIEVEEENINKITMIAGEQLMVELRLIQKPFI